MRKQRKSATLIAVLAGVSLIAAACGDDDDTGTTGGTGGDTAAPRKRLPAAAPTPLAAPPSPPAAQRTPPAAPTDTTGGATDTTGGGAAPQGGTVTFGTAQEFNSLNNNLAETNSVKNGQITTIVLPDALPFNGSRAATRCWTAI